MCRVVVKGCLISKEGIYSFYLRPPLENIQLCSETRKLMRCFDVLSAPQTRPWIEMQVFSTIVDCLVKICDVLRNEVCSTVRIM